MPRARALPLLLAALLAPAPALAAPPSTTPLPTAPPPSKPPASPGRAGWLRYNLPIDLTIIGLGGAAWITSEILKPNLSPTRCRWCNPSGADRAIKNALRWNDTRAADITSYVTGFALAPIAAYGLDAAVVFANGGTAKEWGIDALVITEAIVIASDINQLIKFAVGRERPFVHDLTLTDKARTGQPSDNNLSFYSGHTTLAFVAAASSGTIASLRGYKAAPYIWATGMTLAVATGYLRIAADRHYFTDVLMGATLGTAVGVLVPFLHRPCTASGPCVTGVSSSPTPGGAVVGASGFF